MKRQVALVFCLIPLVLAFLFCGGCKRTPPEQTGMENPEDLAREYLQAVSKKDLDHFGSLLLDKDDLRPFARQLNKQNVTIYHQFVLRDFKTKNRDFLGKELKFVAFRLGREIWGTDKYGLHRGSTIIAELPDGKKVNLEINFISRLGPKWKVFSLRYLKDLKGANPGQTKTLPGAKFGPEVGGFQLKIKKIDPDEEKEKPAGQGEKPDSSPEAVKPGTDEKAQAEPPEPGKAPQDSGSKEGKKE